jgi:ribose transport system permease protein
MPALLAAAIALTRLAHPDFGPFEIQTLALGALPLALAAAAQAIVMIGGGIDLSIGSLIAVANVLSASLMQHATFKESLAWSALVLACGAAAGFSNGLIVAVSRIPDVVATLTTEFIWGSVALLILESPGGGAPAGYANIAAGSDFGPWLPNALVLMILAVAGIRVWRVLFADYLFCAILAAITGFVLVGGTDAADLSLADGFLLPLVAAVVIGGTSIFGGRGGYAGTIVGALILTVLTGLLTLLDVSEPIKQILYGAIILSLVAAYARLTE